MHLPRLSFALVALSATVLSASAEIGTPTLTWPATVDPATGVALTVTVTGNPDYVYADVRQGENKVRVFFTKGAGDAWNGSLPPGRAGTAYVRVTAETEDGQKSFTVEQPVPYEETGTAATALTNQRYPYLNNWPSTLPSNGALDDDWMGRNLDRESVVVQAVSLIGATSTNMPSFSGTSAGAGGLLCTRNPVADGVGSLWLKAKMANTNRVNGGTLAIDRITWVSGSGGRAVYAYTEIAKINVPAATEFNEWHQFHVILQSENPSAARTDQGYYRIRNKTQAADSEVEKKNAAVDVCDIVLTPLLPDVVVCKDAADYSPGYPSVQDPIEFHVSVSNRFAFAPAGHFTPRLVWRQGENAAWHETVMTNRAGRTAQGDGTYACVLSRETEQDLSDGPFEYFYEVGFSGYTPTFPARKNKGEMLNNIVNYRFALDEVPFLIHTNAWALLTDAAENVNESRAPARKPDFLDAYDSGREPDFADYGQGFDVAPDSAAWDRGRWGWGLEAAFDLRNLDEGWPSGEAWFPYRTEDRQAALAEGAIQIPGTYRYLTFLAPEGVRHFRSQYNNLSVVPSDAASNHLDAAYSMQQVGDYTWQAIIHVTNAIDTAFSVTGAYQHVEGWTEYLPGPFEWGQVNQDATAINPPMAGYIARHDLWEDDQATQGGVWPEDSTWAPVRTVIDYDGFLMFRYCTTNGSYQIRRAAWQDFNQWQADDNYYSRSFGIYNTKTFRSDLEGRNLTTFEAAKFTALEIESGLEPTLTADPLESTYMGGVLANNVWVVDERERRFKGNNESTVANRAIRLSTWPRVLGSIETTGTTREDGRDSLSFRVRVSSDDDRAAIYTADPSTWANAQDYAVVARTTVANMSDGTPSLSILGYYQNERNYLEARISQWSSRQTNAQNPYRSGLRVQLFKVVDGEVTEMTPSRRPHNATSGQEVIPQNGEQGKTLASGNYQLTRGNSTASTSWGWTFVLRVTSSSVQIDIYEPGSGTLPSTQKWRYEYGAPGLTGGTFGFNARDCDATIMPYVFDATDPVSFTVSSVPTKKAVSNSNAGSWNLGVRELYGYVSPWTVTDATGTSPVKLRRPPPKVYWRVLAYRTGEEHSANFKAPVPGDFGEDWSTSWDLVGLGMDGVWKTESFAWQTVTVPLHFWDDSFLRIQALNDNGAGLKSEGMLMVDDLASDAWRGQEVFDEDYHDERNETLSWIATYAAIHQDGRTGRDYELARSRANPNPDLTAGEQPEQSVSTPMLYDGLGDILFNYHAETAPVEFVIEAVDEDGLATQLGSSIIAVPGDPVGTAYRACLRRGTSGRLRVRTLDNGQYGTLYLDNVRATDYPNTGDSSWEVYNVLVSSFKNNPGLKFDGSSSFAANYRSAVVNDGPAHDTEGGNVFADNVPYVQTPAIETGVGEVSFWYRAHPDNHGTPARLVLKVANSSAAPDEEWVPLQPRDLNTDPVENPFLEEERANLNAITNIVDDQWRYFSAEFFKQDFRLLRIYSVSEEGVPNRVMLDNVLITEPVRASIDVGSIEFDPGVPLCTQDTGVRVRLVNPRMNPTDIRVYLDWYASSAPPAETNITSSFDVVTTNWTSHTDYLSDGTEITTRRRNIVTTTYAETNFTRLPGALPWGYENWGEPTGTLTFTNIADNAYAFASVERIPTDKYPPDTVFQYCVRVLYEGRFKAPVYSETQGQVRNGFWFTNPGWYEPIDLNEAFGTEEQPVAHFWNFTVSTNCVFVNEVMPDVWYWGISGQDERLFLEQQFVELMGPEGGEVTDWSLWHQGRDDMNLIVYGNWCWTNWLENAFFQPPTNAEMEKNWGFYVLGGAAVAARDADLFPADQPYAAWMYVPGALMLKRSMGAYADRVVWGAEEDCREWIQKGWTWIGNRYIGAGVSFALQGNSLNPDENPLTWGTTGTFTIGGYNDYEETMLWYLDPSKEVVVVPPEIRLSDITAYALENGVASITFSVTSTNDVALTADDFAWYVETTTSLTLGGDASWQTLGPDKEFETADLWSVGGDRVQLVSPDAIEAEAGEELTVTVRVTPDDFASDNARFFRIRAVPKAR